MMNSNSHGLSRRSFLRAAAALGVATTPGILQSAAAALAESGPSSDEVLVVLELAGGNDGLNTLVPYESDIYHRNRPSLAVSPSSVLKVGSSGSLELGLHPRLAELHELFDEGHLAIIQGIGYPNPSRSHFRSMDIWHTARPDEEVPTKGWIGRVLETDERAGALHVGGEKRPLAVAGERHVASLQNLDFLDALTTERGKKLRRQMRALHSRPRLGEVERVRGLTETTLAGLEQILAVRERSTPVEYPGSGIGERMRWIGQLIAGSYPSRIYYASQGGYDTHAQQGDGHPRLLGDLSAALGTFFRHLKEVGAEKRVTVLVFSEFGRRLKENASLGTDHGCAAPAFVISGRVRGGLHGDAPSLTDLDQGDLIHTVDFRRVYASVLEDVLGVESTAILGGRFEKLPIL